MSCDMVLEASSCRKEVAREKIVQSQLLPSRSAVTVAICLLCSSIKSLPLRPIMCERHICKVVSGLQARIEEEAVERKKAKQDRAGR